MLADCGKRVAPAAYFRYSQAPGPECGDLSGSLRHATDPWIPFGFRRPSGLHSRFDVAIGWARHMAAATSMRRWWIRRRSQLMLAKSSIVSATQR